jgi:isopenicillin N synthase-like dioxygenase
VVLTYEQVTNKDVDLSGHIEKAYGPGALGVLAIRGVPGFGDAKTKVLSQAHTLAHLSPDQLLALEDEKSMFNVGWSHGKEKLGDKPDLAKGSFYFNPLTDCPGSQEDRDKFPVSYPCNIWPTEAMPDFEPAAKGLGKLMHEMVVHLSCHIDKYAKSKVASYKENLISDVLRTTEKAKGRLLYYFPLPDSVLSEKAADSWIGWHNDSGFLTALAGDCYVNDETGEVIPNPDPEAGLYVVDRTGESVRVEIPADCMAVQLGECVQIVTGGALQATPHCVRGAIPKDGSGIKVGRVSHPCFIDCVPTFPLTMPESASREEVFGKMIDSKVPALESRWTEDGMLFGDFLQVTFSRYYDHNKPKA